MIEEKNKRCFIAINLPETAKQEIFEVLSKKIPKNYCKPVEEKNLHITMLFLGNYSSEEIKSAREKMLALQKNKKFEIELSSIGNFNERVFWIGTKKGNSELQALAAELASIFEKKVEQFSAHLTIARNKSLNKKEAAELVEKLGKENFSTRFVAESIDFMESELSSNGTEYKKIFSVGFSG